MNTESSLFGEGERKGQSNQLSQESAGEANVTAELLKASETIVSSALGQLQMIQRKEEVLENQSLWPVVTVHRGETAVNKCFRGESAEAW